MDSLLFGHILQYILAGVGVWQLVAGSLLYGAIILMIVIASDIIVQKKIIQ